MIKLKSKLNFRPKPKIDTDIRIPHEVWLKQRKQTEQLWQVPFAWMIVVVASGIGLVDHFVFSAGDRDRATFYQGLWKSSYDDFGSQTQTMNDLFKLNDELMKEAYPTEKGRLTYGACDPGSIILTGSTSGTATITVPATTGATTTFALPDSKSGMSVSESKQKPKEDGQFLRTCGSGVTSWTSPKVDKK